jgi:hypothetical protein
MLALGTLGAYHDIAAQQASNRVQQDLITRLLQQGDTRVNSEFWTCFRTAFLSDERIVCSVLNDDLSQRPNRYPPYDAMVRAAPNPAYVFPLPSPQADNLRDLAKQKGWRLDTTMVDGVYVIFHLHNG